MNPNSLQMGGGFSPIDWSSMASGDQEYQKRQGLNKQIEWLNQMSELNPNNGGLQKMLAEQYMGMVAPQQPDYDSEFQKGMDLLQMGTGLNNPEFANAGKKILAGIPGMKDYFQTDQKGTTDSKPVDTTYLDQLQKDYSVDNVTNPNYGRNKSILEAANKNPSLAEQYYSTSDPGFFNLYGQASNDYDKKSFTDKLNPFGGLDMFFGAKDKDRRRQVFGINN